MARDRQAFAAAARITRDLEAFAAAGRGLRCPAATARSPALQRLLNSASNLAFTAAAFDPEAERERPGEILGEMERERLAKIELPAIREITPLPDILAARLAQPIGQLMERPARPPKRKDVSSAEINREFLKFLRRSPELPNREACRKECTRLGLPACAWDELQPAHAPGKPGKPRTK
jgi:hypothetical protein